MNYFESTMRVGLAYMAFSSFMASRELLDWSIPDLASHTIGIALGALAICKWRWKP